MKRFTGLIAGVAGLLAGCTAILTQPVAAADYPTRSVHIIVGYPAGGSTDIVARLIGNWLSVKLGQQFIVENRPGAGNNIGTEAVAKAAPDGYTMLLVNPANTINASLYKKLSFTFLKDIDPVANVIEVPNVMEVHPDVPAKTVAEFIAYAKANPGKINVAATGAGSIPHLAGAWLHSATNTQATYIQYKGTSPLLLDLIAERVDVNPSPLVNGLQYIKIGKLKILGIMSDEHSELLPGVQTVAEQGVPGYDYSSWLGFVAPRGTPPAIVNKLSAELAKAAHAPDVAQKFGPEGTTMVGSNPKQVQDLIATEVSRWSKLVQESGIKLEE